ncbi:MAG TPA: tryptophan 2,3-dioxygenase family protein [Actinomycetota bacterium]|nr:tryptophan 2,3-dioxygenase family protein [Actinomycetota bacterium]
MTEQPKDPTHPHFGEEGRRLSYGTYLKVPELIDLQLPLARPEAHDELLFIVVHQVYELWFRQLLFELDAIREHLFAGRAPQARHLLERVHEIERVLVAQVAVLETMTPSDFMDFRRNLAPASGFQSVQFREIEFVSGLKDEGVIARLDPQAGEAARLKRRLGEPTLWDAYCELLTSRGLPMPDDDADRRRDSLLRMTRERDRFVDEHAIGEALLTHDELFALWRHRHVLMVERQIGTKSGTGGSAGAPYLRSTLTRRFYPELWDLRSYL